MFLKNGDSETLLPHAEEPSGRYTRRLKRQLLSDYLPENPVTVCNIALLAANLGLCLILLVTVLGRINPEEEPRTPPLLYSPARAAVVAQTKVINAELTTVNEYNGKPNPSNDAAWTRLFQYANIRVTPEELQPTNRDSVLLADGSGDFYGTLDVYHQLHCVKYIREYVHPEYYDMKNTFLSHIDHVDHCLDTIRQVIMCRGDIALTTYEWIPNYKLPWPNFTLEHECRDWESIDSWSRARAIDVNDYSLLVHPDLGPAFLEPDDNQTAPGHM